MLQQQGDLVFEDPVVHKSSNEGPVAVASQSEQKRTPSQQALQRAGNAAAPCEGVYVAGGPQLGEALPSSSSSGALSDGDELLFKQRRQAGNYRVRYDRHGGRVVAQVLGNMTSSGLLVGLINNK